MTRIHKTDGRVEAYNSEKLKSGIVHACRAVMTPLGAAERFGHEVEKKISKSVKRQAAMTSRDLKRLAKQALAGYHPDAAEVFALEEEF
jgi:transcriptional regulator NrdR family protein